MCGFVLEGAIDANCCFPFGPDCSMVVESRPKNSKLPFQHELQQPSFAKYLYIAMKEKRGMLATAAPGKFGVAFNRIDAQLQPVHLS